MATDTTPPPAVSRATAWGVSNRADTRRHSLPTQKDEAMTTFSIAPVTDVHNADSRSTWRLAVSDAIADWHTAGRPRDAVSVETITAVTDTLSVMTAITWGEELTRVTSLAGLVTEVTDYLADGDASRQDAASDDVTTVTITVEPVAEVDPHALCAEESAQLRKQLRDANASITDPSDYRLDDLWTRVHEVADSRGYCSTFDEIAEELGIPARTVEVTAVITATVCVTVSASELSDDWRNAIAEAMDTDYIDWEVSSYERD